MGERGGDVRKRWRWASWKGGDERTRQIWENEDGRTRWRWENEVEMGERGGDVRTRWRWEEDVEVDELERWGLKKTEKMEKI
jgi:hypothetical protein